MPVQTSKSPFQDVLCLLLTLYLVSLQFRAILGHQSSHLLIHLVLLSLRM
jgi:hypothetical protein